MQAITESGQDAILNSPVVKLVGLRRERTRAALTQRQLATRAGVAFSTIARIESGAEAHLTTARKLADALGCEPRALMEDEPS